VTRGGQLLVQTASRAFANTAVFKVRKWRPNFGRGFEFQFWLFGISVPFYILIRITREFWNSIESGQLSQYHNTLLPSFPFQLSVILGSKTSA
jgi:hypothetical protein